MAQSSGFLRYCDEVLGIKYDMANGDKPPGKDEPKDPPKKPEQPSEPAKPQ